MNSENITSQSKIRRQPILASPSIDENELALSIILKGKPTQELLDSTKKKLIENNHFKSLKIHCSDYSFTFFSTLLDTAFNKKSLTTLDLSSNQLNSDRLMRLVKYFEKKQFDQITEINLDSNDLGEDHLLAVTYFLKRFPKLKTVILTKNNIEKLEGLFLNHLKTSEITEVICLHGNKESIFKEITEILNEKRTKSTRKKIQNEKIIFRRVFTLNESSSDSE